MAFIIQNIHNPSLFWNNDDGWVGKSSATVFSKADVLAFDLPLEGKWMPI